MPKTLLVTSTRPNEGKTATAIAMAILGVRAGSRVLLVDADLRAPSLARIAGVENDFGLAQLLAGSDDYDAFIVTSPTLGVQILPSGPQPPNAAELLSNVRAEEVFRELVKRFDYVIVDAPPVLGLADVPILAQLSERVLFVVQAAGVPVRGLQNALRRLQSAEARIIGGVLTRVDGATESYGYGYGYGYGYSYNYGEMSNAKKR
jgi:succinoglycan biosynthesis transport protein ExoP